jgi:2-keto-4-pentenoate hydratase/2-oxohepta-3-ene-1,7-dioic acid hydratase in catechol pathway
MRKVVVSLASVKLFRFGPAGRERPGVVLDDGVHVDVSAFGEDYGEAFFAEDGLARLAAWLGQHGSACPEISTSTRLGPVVQRPSKIVCIGLNYRAHAAETSAELPTEPKIFMKATSALSGPFDDVVLPRGSRKTDYEVELAVVIGQRASYVDESRALEHVAGYALFNDYSERDFQKERAGQWVKGKSADSFAPIGPYLVTADALSPFDLRLWLTVNGEKRQEASTKDMVFDVRFLVSYLSQFMTLLPGDVISTGTPSGVGMGFRPPRFLAAGDVVEYGIDGLGQARQVVVSRDA